MDVLEKELLLGVNGFTQEIKHADHVMSDFRLVSVWQEYFTMNADQQGAVKALMQRLIRGGLVDQWEWPTLQEKWLKDSFYFSSSWGFETNMHVSSLCVCVV